MTMMKLKKAFLASAVASTLFAASASADMSMSVGGEVDAQFGFRNEGNAYEYFNPIAASGEKRKNKAFVHDTTLNLKVFGNADSMLGGIRFGAELVINADTTNSKYHLPALSIETTDVSNGAGVIGKKFSGISYDDSRGFAYNENSNARKATIFVEGDFGRVELGNTEGATKKMQLDAGSVAAGNGGVHGDSGLWINPVATFGNFRTPDFYTNKESFNHLDDLFLPVEGALPYSTELATASKISYYSPVFSGLQFGLTFTPDTDGHGTVANAATISKNSSQHGFGFENVIGGGFTYDVQASDFNVKFSILAQTGKAKTNSGKLFAANRLDSLQAIADKTKLEDLKSYEFGFAADFMGVGFAGSYGHQDGLLSTLGANKYYTIGTGYEAGPWEFSINYMRNKQDSRSFLDSDGNATTRKAEFNNLVFDVAYNCQGFMPYVSIAKYKAVRPAYFADPEMKDSGTVLLFGTKLSF